MTVKASLTLLFTAVALAACQSSPGPRMVEPVERAAMVEGEWTDPNGLVSTFRGGKFDTRTTDAANAVMASGTYRNQPNGLVEISLFSHIKKTSSQVNCRLAGSSQLNCTSDSGAQFSLVRRG